MRSRAWFLTLNNPAHEDSHYEGIFRNHELIKYYVFQRERGESGTVHIHVYLYFTTVKNRRQVLDLSDMRGSDARARLGTHKQLRDYCTKVETRIAGPYEGGSPPQQGRRTDIHDLVDYIREHPAVEMATLYEHDTLRYAAFKYSRHVRSMQSDVMVARSCMTQTTWLYGETGAGKSYRARLMASLDGPPYYKMPSNKWWDRYRGEDTVIDEFASSVPYRELLRLVDEYPHRVESKGGSLQFCSKRLIITSHYPPWEQYPNIADKSELRRRLEGRVFRMCGRVATLAAWGS